MPAALQVRDLTKRFTLHMQDSAELSVISGAAFNVESGECVVLSGPSGTGKSSILKMIYGTYPCTLGSIRVLAGTQYIDVATAEARSILALRRTTIGYVSQFLRVIPRVAALALVAEPLIRRGATPNAARDEAAALLRRLNVPERLWSLPPSTFSGGEQQRVNIARGFACPLPIMLLDEPTASLDAENREAVVSIISEAKARGAAILGIFHDKDVRDRVADRLVDVTTFQEFADSLTESRNCRTDVMK